MTILLSGEDWTGTMDVRFFHDQDVYICHAVVSEEDDGQFSAIAINLPGAASQGDTVEEALANLREAFQGVIECHVDHDDAIPWNDDAAVPDYLDGQPLERWIAVNV